MRFASCGSVDDGKSTLIGRLLFDNGSVAEDQLRDLARDSQQFGTRGKELDFALLMDGLQAEREQAITIDVAYRFFGTPQRAFIVADAPGHEQYTRNMATAASTADAAVVIVDARNGVLAQTRRHTRILGLFGVGHVILAVNKMDLAGWSQARFDAIVSDYRSFAATCGIVEVSGVPTCAIDGDNVVRQSARMPWYDGAPVLRLLETIDTTDRLHSTLRLPVQWVNRPRADFRGYAGRIAHGDVTLNDRVRVYPSRVESTVSGILSSRGDVNRAVAGESITLQLDPPVDVSRGDVIAGIDDPPSVADQFEARLLWMGDHPLLPGRQYLMKLAAREVNATVTDIKFVDDVNTGAHLSGRTLRANETAVVNVSTAQPLAFEPYQRSRRMGGFILIDRETFATVGAGMILFELRRAANLHWQKLSIDQAARGLLKHQSPQCLWFTGLSGSGKSTIANLLEKRLHADGRHTYLLDGDNVRHGLNRDLGFTEADRVENIRRVSEVAKLMVDAGLIVIVSFISPFRSERRAARQLFDGGEFIEIFIDTALGECERRDPKGLYAKARAGTLVNFTGLDSPYERPEQADVIVLTEGRTPEDCANQIYEFLRSRTDAKRA